MPPRSMTASSTPRLSEFARHFVYPDGITRTVWPRVEAKGAELGLGFDWWQRQLGTVCLGYGADGKYVATVGGVGLSIPRQVGKTYFVLALLVIMCILFPGLQVVWTAHHLRTSTKTFTALRGICRRRKVAPHVLALRSANGEQQAEFHNGSMIMFGSRKMGFGRGFDEIDVEVFDEAQILDSKSLEDMIAATNQARHEHGALLFFMGTPPRPNDPSDAFTYRRAKAIAGKAINAIWLEIGAKPGSDPDDRAQWPVMNPSYPTRTPLESMLRLRENLSDEDSWNREGRGIWDEITGGKPFPNWPNCLTAHAPADGVAPTALGVDMSHERVIAITGAWVDPLLPDDTHLELLSVDVSGDTAAAVEWIVARAGRRIPVVIDGASPAASMIPTLKARKVKVVTTGPADMGKACGGLHDAIRDGHAWHVEATDDNGQRALDDAMSGCTKRNIGTAGAWGLDRSNPELNIAPAVSAVLAHFGGAMSKRKRTKTRGVVFS
jgi:hypothetical protein